jgi:hypothetical protein
MVRDKKIVHLGTYLQLLRWMHELNSYPGQKTQDAALFTLVEFLSFLLSSSFTFSLKNSRGMISFHSQEINAVTLLRTTNLGEPFATPNSRTPHRSRDYSKKPHTNNNHIKQE